MDALRYLSRSINLMNMALASGLLCLTIFVVQPLFHLKIDYALPRGQSGRDTLEVLPPARAASPAALDYAIIGENNLFHPERRVPPEKTVQQVLPKPELILYGTLIADGSSLAFIEDKKSPKSSPGRGKRQSVVKKGDVLGGFVLNEVLADRILLKRGEESMTVYLMQADKQRGGEGQPAKAASTPPAGGVAGPTPAAAASRPPAVNMRAIPQRLPVSPAPALVSKETRRGRVYRGQQ